MAPNATEELETHDATDIPTPEEHHEYDTTGSAGDFGNKGYFSGDYGSGSLLFTSRDQFEPRMPDGAKHDDEYRREYEAGRRGSFLNEREPELSGLYRTNRGLDDNKHDGPRDQMHGVRYGYRQGDFRGNRGPGYFNKDQSLSQRYQFDGSPFGRNFGGSFDTYGYRGGDYGRYRTGMNYRRYGDYERPAYSGNYGTYSYNDGYDNRLGRRSFGEVYGRGPGKYSHSGDYTRPGFEGQFNPYGNGRYQYGRNYDRYGGDYGSYGLRRDYGRSGRDQNPYGERRYGRDYFGQYGYDKDYRGSSDYYRPYNNRDSYYGRRSYEDSFGFGTSPYGSYFTEHDPYRRSYLQNRERRSSLYGYDSSRYGSGYRSDRERRETRPVSGYGYLRSQYGYPNEYSRNQLGYDRDQQYGYGGNIYGYGGNRYGYGGSQYEYRGNQQGYGRKHYGYNRDQYGQRRDQYGYRDNQNRYGDSQYGYRPGGFEGRGQVSRGQFEFSGKYPTYEDHQPMSSNRYN